MRSRPIAALATGVLVYACGADPEPTLFELRSARETGITFANTLVEDDSVYNALDFDYLYNGGGVGAGDVNGDGLPDLYFSGNMVSSRLYLNRGDLRFEDVTEAAGVGTDVWVNGVTFVDIDQDGRLDIYLSVGGPGPDESRANLLFVNRGWSDDGTPVFEERAAEYGIADIGYSTHAVFFDHDGDGDLDLYVLTNSLERFNRNMIRPKLVRGEAASTDRLYRNDGPAGFTDVSAEAGILVEGYGLGVAVSDLNADGLPDIYVANDFLSNDLVWINNGDGTFTDRAADYLKHQTHNGMGTDVADYDNDGLVDIVVLDMLPPDNFGRKMMVAGGNYDRFHLGLRHGYQPQYMRNTLQRNVGVGPAGHPVFSEIGQLAGVHETNWSWAPLFADLDNDGAKDLVVTNGYRRDVTNLDYIAYLQEGSRVGAEAERRTRLLQGLRMLPEIRLANYAFRNRGDLTFEDRSAAWGIDAAGFSNGAVYSDLDRDGDLDIVVSNIDDVAHVYENRAERLPAANHLRIALAGPQGNRDGYGTRVEVVAGGLQQLVEQSPVRGYQSSVEPILHFGLGGATVADSLHVLWPDGSHQVLKDVPANRVLVLDHAAAEPCTEQVAPLLPIFRSADDVHGLDMLHEEREVVDFKVTPLLPHKHSQAGPGIAVGDVDGDGRDDVFVGADRGGERAVYLQVAPGRFERRPFAGAVEADDMGALFFDADGDGDVDLYVVSGGSYIVNDEAVYDDRLYLNDGSGRLELAREALPTSMSSGSVVTAADFDGDGDLDLFVGGRIVPGRYPLPPRSFLLRNDTRSGGRVRFTDVTDSLAPALAYAGLVTAALWTDFDGDGRSDLLIAGEWMPLTFLHNRGDRFEDVTAETGLGATNGWWNSLVGADFDGDGDIDYIAGNLGLNTDFRPSRTEPATVHAADFDGNGSIDPVLSRVIGGKRYAVAPRDLMIDQMIGIKGRFPRYADYARATFEETLSAEEREGAYVAHAFTFASSHIENLGSGRFALRPLPLGAQVAPIFGMLADDYDGDGAVDVLLAGNSYATETQTGWHDASTGGLLRGDGTGGFEFLDGVASGFFVDGNARGIAELVLDVRTSVVLVVQNGDSLRVFTPPATPARNVPLQPLDTYAILTMEDGSTRRVELRYGSTYLSQSSRHLKVPAGVRSVVIHDSMGKARSVR